MYEELTVLSISPYPISWISVTLWASSDGKLYLRSPLCHGTYANVEVPFDRTARLGVWSSFTLSSKGPEPTWLQSLTFMPKMLSVANLVQRSRMS
jgi:hypothetical protein